MCVFFSFLIGIILIAELVTYNNGFGMNEEYLAKQLDLAYRGVKSSEGFSDKLYMMRVEKLSYLIIAASNYSFGSKHLDAVFTEIQVNSPTIVVPRYVMTPKELSQFLYDLAKDDKDELVYANYLRKTTTISELIFEVKKKITRRSGFIFNQSVPVIRSQ